MSIILVAMFFPTQGTKSLYLFFVAGFFLVGVLYGFVGRKVQSVMASASRLPGEAAEGIMLIGMVQSPGAVVLGDSEIVLMPIVGESVSIALSEIGSVKEVSWFNGKKLWGKRGFYLIMPEKKRIGFAVTESVGIKWSYKLKK